MPLGATRVCMITSAAPVRAQIPASSGSRRPETSLTITAPAATAAAATAGLWVSTETSAPRRPAARPAADALELLLDRDRRAVAAGGLAADVEQVGPAASSARACSRRDVERRALAAVGERVRRRVDDAHQQRPPAERQGPAGGAQDGRAHFTMRSESRLTVTLPALSAARATTV